MSKRAQKILIWWAIAFATIYGLCLIFLLHMVPPPSPTWGADRVAAFYTRHHDSMRIGAVICSWTSAFMMPLAIVCGVQVSRHEKGRPIWGIACVCGGALMSIFLVLPPLFWGVAAYTSDRPHQLTLLMHELAMLTLTTTDQYYVFMWVAIAIVCLKKNEVLHTPFPRWMGYLTVWIALMFEAGAIAFLPRTGPFAWNGLLVFWSPLILFGVWIAAACTLLLKAINRQEPDEIVVPMAEAGRVPSLAR